MCDVLYEQVVSNSREWMCGSVFMVEQPFFSLLEFGLFPFTASPLKVVLFVDIMATRWKFMVYNTSINKTNKKKQSSPSPVTELALVFRIWYMFSRPIVKSSFCFSIIAVNPFLFSHNDIFSHKFSSLFAHTEYSWLISRHFVFALQSTDVAQIWLIHTSYPNF